MVMLARHLFTATAVQHSLIGSCLLRQPRRTSLRHLKLTRSALSVTNRHRNGHRSEHSDPAMFYSELILDRAEHFRKEPEKLSQLAEAPEAKLLPWKDGKFLFVLKTDIYSPVLCNPLSEFVKFLDTSVGHIFMGFERESQIPIFGGTVHRSTVKNYKDYSLGSVLDGEALAEQIGQGEWLSPRIVGPKIEKHDAALIAAVNGLMEWHVGNLFCGQTGETTVSISGGYSRKAKETGKIAFPRIDPAIICLVTCGEYCLLGRHQKWKTARYSLLAGYLEVGETMEQAVAREVFEESNIEVDPSSIQYRGSQPWPFPRSLMIGFMAQLPASQHEAKLEGTARQAAEETGVRDDEIQRYLGVNLPKPVPQPEEMQDVRWFHFEYLRCALESLPNDGSTEDFTIPGSHAIAHTIIDSWMSEMESGRPSWKGNQIDDVHIDDAGRFKYVLVRISDASHSKLVVRGHRGKAYHMNVFEDIRAEAEALGLDAVPLGGGRIEHDASLGQIEIYGYSSAFGTAVHDISAVLCRRAYPYYERISFSYSGY